MIFGIAACDPRGILGKGNQVPWDYPEDRHFFSHVIGKHPIVMGRKTWESLPKHYCFHRKVIVFSQRTYDSSHCLWVSSLKKFNDLILPSPIFLLGGGEIFSLFLENHKVKGCFLTHIQKYYDMADIGSFPNRLPPISLRVHMSRDPTSACPPVFATVL